MNNWIEVSAERLTANFHLLQAAAGPDTTLLAVIKANAYGHGAGCCAPILARAGATWLGVTCASEGARVRQALASAGIEIEAQPEILIMSGFLPDDVAAIHEHRLTPVLWTSEQIAWLAQHAGSLRIHVEVDTGMGRQGVLSGQSLAHLLREITATGLILDGIFTHLCSSEVAGSPVTALQRKRFEQVVAQLQTLGATPRFLHVGNSSAIDNPDSPCAPEAAWLAPLAAQLGATPMVRPGLALYGYTLPLETSGNPADPTRTGSLTSASFKPDMGIHDAGTATRAPVSPPRIHFNLHPVLTWKARILAIRTLIPGETVGYNATFTAAHPMLTALLPAGYADGLRRELSSTNTKSAGWVMIQGQRAPILGRISMNLTVVDISAIPNVQPGDEAILLGDGITADDHATLAHTIAYEILCSIHPCT